METISWVVTVVVMTQLITGVIMLCVTLFGMLYWSITKQPGENRHVLVVETVSRLNYVCEAAEMAGATAMAVETEKDCKHEDLVLKCGGHFLSLAI